MQIISGTAAAEEYTVADGLDVAEASLGSDAAKAGAAPPQENVQEGPTQPTDAYDMLRAAGRHAHTYTLVAAEHLAEISGWQA